MRDEPSPVSRPSQMAKVRVLMPVRDGAPYLHQALGSLLAQTFKDMDIIVIDDHSLDDSLTIAETWAAKDRRIRVMANRGTGISQALETGRQGMDAPYIARMDADDIAHPQRMEQQLTALEQRPALAGIGSQYIAFAKDQRPGRTSRLPLRAEDCAAYLEIGCPHCHPTMLLRTASVEAAGGYRVAFDGAEDIDLWCRLRALGHPVENLPISLLWYRQHEAKTSLPHLLPAILLSLSARLASSPRWSWMANDGPPAWAQVMADPVLVEFVLMQLVLYGQWPAQLHGQVTWAWLQQTLSRPCPWGDGVRVFWLSRLSKLLIKKQGPTRTTRIATSYLAKRPLACLRESQEILRGDKQRAWSRIVQDVFFKPIGK